MAIAMGVVVPAAATEAMIVIATASASLRANRDSRSDSYCSETWLTTVRIAFFFRELPLFAFCLSFGDCMMNIPFY